MVAFDMSLTLYKHVLKFVYMTCVEYVNMCLKVYDPCLEDCIYTCHLLMFVYMAGLGVCVYICMQSALYYAVTKAYGSYVVIYL